MSRPDRTVVMRGACAVVLAGAIPWAAPAMAQPPPCDSWQEELEVVFPDRIAQGTNGQLVVRWKEGSSTSTPVTHLVAQVDDGPVLAAAVPAPGSETLIPVSAGSRSAVRMAVSWQQDTGEVLACAGTETGVAKATPSRKALVRYAGRMRPALIAWGVEARPAMQYLDRGRALLQGLAEDDIVGALRVAPQAGMAVGQAAPILRRAAQGFSTRAGRITPPRGMAPAQRRLTREFSRFARSVEVMGNVLGRVDSPLALISAGFTIAKISIAAPGRKWAGEMVANYDAAGLATPRWVTNLAKE